MAEAWVAPGGVLAFVAAGGVVADVGALLRGRRRRQRGEGPRSGARFPPSRLYHRSSLCSGRPTAAVARLQRVQNNAARLVLRHK